ncbi:MAG: selenocysteine-specific translation elongation factor [Candidatus Thorarchaeota archaeon]|nr:selenocysteine-specific translation elongation factor [Candidatus Thorarchaeota archaeon]
MKDLVPVHIGLVGHIDHGKTALAKALSEKVSTAGLDRHPQAQERGITIDLGFTMFTLNDYIVTLVDAPGHADLIRSVVAGASIIDLAILVVAADEGPKIQTGEHIVILRSMGIDSMVVVITKSDLVRPERLSAIKHQIEQITQGAGFRRVEYTQVSTKTGAGIEQLKEALRNVIEPRKRDTGSSFLMPIDHVFPIKGHGTVVTGTIQRGVIATGDKVQIMPQGAIGKVRSLQTFGEAKVGACAGERVGINVPELSHDSISRGDYLCLPGSLSRISIMVARLDRNPLYRERITNRMIVSATVAMATVTAEIVPFESINNKRVVLDEVDDKQLELTVLLHKPLAVEKGMRILLTRTDLPPSKMRIIGAGTVTDISDTIVLHKRRKRLGTVTRLREDDALVQGLASSKRVAEALIGTEVYTTKGVKGVIRSPFGTRGVVSIEFREPVSEEDEVIYERFVTEDVTFGC